MSFFKKSENEQNIILPVHIGIIMDGNGRWAKKRGMPRYYGHKYGAKKFREILEYCLDIGVRVTTVYAFSTENWNRPQAEVQGLMQLLVKCIHEETPTLQKNNVRLQTIGNTKSLPEETYNELMNSIEATSKNTGTTLILALSYSSRWEIKEAIKGIVADAKNGNLTDEDIDENTLGLYLNTKDYPDPDLLIRTSGEYRISNFLLWQIAYTELYFTQKLWPDFRKEDLVNAIVDYQSRQRRFGKTGDQITLK